MGLGVGIGLGLWLGLGVNGSVGVRAMVNISFRVIFVVKCRVKSDLRCIVFCFVLFYPRLLE